MAQATYRLSNWSTYNRALVERGSLSIWLSKEAAEAWRYDGPPQWGRDPIYSDFAIETCLRLRLVYSLPLRQTQGFVESVFALMDVDLPVPDYSTLSRRAGDLAIDLSTQSNDDDGEAEQTEPRHIVIDSSGLKVYGEGEWKQRQHGKSKRRTWRKIHIGVDPETGEITATRLTENSKHDCSQVAALLAETLLAETLLAETLDVRPGDELKAEALAARVAEAPALGAVIASVGGDGAYDKWKSYDAIAAVEARAVIPPARNAKIKQHGNCKAKALPRDEAIRYIRRHGRKKWKRSHGYHRRSLAETAIFRFKRIIGGVLRSRKLVNQVTEARLGCQILNRMRSLGMPQSYAVAPA